MYWNSWTRSFIRTSDTLNRRRKQYRQRHGTAKDPIKNRRLNDVTCLSKSDNPTIPGMPCWLVQRRWSPQSRHQRRHQVQKFSMPRTRYWHHQHCMRYRLIKVDGWRYEDMGETIMRRGCRWFIIRTLRLNHVRWYIPMVFPPPLPEGLVGDGAGGGSGDLPGKMTLLTTWTMPLHAAMSNALCQIERRCNGENIPQGRINIQRKISIRRPGNKNQNTYVISGGSSLKFPLPRWNRLPSIQTWRVGSPLAMSYKSEHLRSSFLRSSSTITWYNKTSRKKSLFSTAVATSGSDNNSWNAAFVGAKTVNVPGAAKISPRPASTTKSQRIEKSSNSHAMSAARC